MEKRATAVAQKYSDMLDVMEAAGKNDPSQYNLVQDRLINVCDNNFVNAGSVRTIKNSMNILRNLPEENMAIGYASMFGNNNEDEFVRQVQQYAPVIM